MRVQRSIEEATPFTLFFRVSVAASCFSDGSLDRSSSPRSTSWHRDSLSSRLPETSESVGGGWGGRGGMGWVRRKFRIQPSYRRKHRHTLFEYLRFVGWFVGWIFARHPHSASYHLPYHLPSLSSPSPFRLFPPLCFGRYFATTTA